MAVLFTNNATSTAAVAMTVSSTTLTVEAEDAARFPQPSAAGQWFPVTVASTSGVLEIMHCTSRSGTVLTVLRGQEGTPPQVIDIGNRVDHRATAQALAEAATKVDALVSSGDDPPVNPPNNALWFESDTGKLYVFYSDPNTKQWVETYSAAPHASGSLTIDWASVTNKPATFPPALPIPQSGVTDLEADIAFLGTYKAPLASPVFTGDPTAPTQAFSDSSGRIATTAFVKGQAYAPLASPVLTGDPQAPTPVLTDNDTSVATTAFVKGQAYAPLESPEFTGLPKAPTQLPQIINEAIATTAYVANAVSRALRQPNMLVNPCMTITQENLMGSTSSFVASLSDYHPADQWSTTWVTTGLVAAGHSASSSDSPEGGFSGVNSIFLQVSTAQAVVVAGTIAHLVHRIEGYRLAPLRWPQYNSGYPGVLRFWVKFPLAGVYCVSFRSGGALEHYVTEYTVNTANVWQEVTITVPVPGIGDWTLTASAGLTIGFTIAGGSTYQTTPGSWQSGNKYSTAGQANGLSTVGKYIIAKVGFYADPFGTGVAPMWEYQDDIEELKTCQRYYYKTPETPVGMLGYWYGTAAATSMYAGIVPFPVHMRATPVAATVIAPTYTNCSALTLSPSPREASARVTVTAAGAYRAWAGQYSFSARMAT
jgi:hypothetical protein